MKIKFWKMHGARNDFVLFDDRRGAFPADDRAFITHVSARHSGIGAEGVILLQKSKTADFFMRFFNPDGGEAEMCGNGVRCAARLAFERGIAGETMRIETVAGEVSAEIVDTDQVRIFMTEPTDWQLDGMLDVGGRSLSYCAVNTGVPHVVMRTGDLKGVDVAEVGAAVRYHRQFASTGTNVSFMQISPEEEIFMRTYERGVEGETLACGTGIVAAALIAARNGWVKLPVTVHPQSGDALSVDAQLTDEGATGVTLLGPAAHVFEGTIIYEEEAT
jgi:diaminopimelate epimerase